MNSTPLASPRLRTAHPGRPYPLGATWDGLGVNFALFSAHAQRVQVVLFSGPDARTASRAIELTERTGPIWHGYVPDLCPGQLYGYRIHGPYHPHQNHRFNHHKVLLDPYARAIGRRVRWHDSLFGYEKDSPQHDLSFSDKDSAAFAPLGVVVAEGYSWEADRPPHIPWTDTVIYETHVEGATMQHPDVPENLRGTYLGLASDPMIRHFQDLGVTTVQLLPVHAKVNEEHLQKLGLENYWGYNSLSYFAPEPSYASNPNNAVREFKTMVRRLHDAGLEVIVDVVYNHTGEGNQLGPTLSFRGIDSRSYYKEDPGNPRMLLDYTGTGNTLDAGDPHVLQLITDSLRYWVLEMHVDGFRFDLASALARDLFEINMLAAFFQVIQQDPVLSQVKLIAEPWDVGPGGYQVGYFPWQWTEWNGRYRDAVRRFWRGDPGILGEFATRIAGSSDLYEDSGRRPMASINFVTAHDGFTIADLTAYDRKYNQANGEHNRDGTDANYSINCGWEGPSQDPEVMLCRKRRRRALMATLMLSQGVPMMLGGDEMLRTQHGNNNAYCQAGPISWYDWDIDQDGHDMMAFVSRLTAFRRAHPNFRRHRFLTGDPDERGVQDVTWWHPKGRQMSPDDWHNPQGRVLGMLLRGDCIFDHDPMGNLVRDETFLVCFNAGARRISFTLPPDDSDAPVLWTVALSTEDGPHDEAFGEREKVSIPPLSVTVLQAQRA